MAILVANNATSYLAGTLTAVATSLTVSSGTGTLFPTISGSDVFYVTLTNTSNQNEIVKVTAKATDTFTIVRAQDGTSALAFAIGDKVELRVIKVVFDDKASLTNDQTFSGANTFSGGILFGAGTAALPSITTTGDTNTGIFFPAADTIAFSEGGAEAMRINSSGNVGIGTTSLTTTALRVAQGITGGTIAQSIRSDGAIQTDVTSAAYYFISSANMASGTIGNLNHYAATQGTIGATVTNQSGFYALGSLIGATNNYSFIAADTAAITAGKTSYGYYSAVNTPTGGGTTYGFYAAGTAVNYFNGNVGINETNPTHELTVGGTASATYFNLGGNTASAPAVDAAITRPANGTLAFIANAAERMRINSSGNVGIGTTANYRLAVVGGATQLSGSTDAAAGLRVQTASGVATLTGINSDNNAFNPIAFYTSATEALRIDTSGNVGIGTTDNSLFNSTGGTTRLAVCGSSSSTDILGNTGASISIINTDTTANNTAGLHFARADTDDTPNYAGASIVAQFPDTQVTGQYPKGLLTFLTSTVANSAPSEKMRIASAGQIGIGGANYGTSGQVLTSGGASAAPSWADAAGGGAWKLISTQTASASSSIDFTGLSSYSRLRLSAQNITVSSTTTDHELRLSSDNGATFISTSSYNNKYAYPTSTTATGYVSSNDTFFALHPIGNGTYTGLAYEILIANFNIAQRTILYGPSSKQSTGATERIMFSSQTGATAMNAIRIFQSSGTITTGTFILEGIVG